MRGLLATKDLRWRSQVVSALLANEFDIHTTRTASDCINLLRKNTYDIVAIDDSLGDLDALEFSLTVREFCGDSPIILIAAPQLQEKILRFKRLANVQFIGTKRGTVSELKTAAKRLQSGLSTRSS